MPQNFYTECARRLPGKLFSKKKKKLVEVVCHILQICMRGTVALWYVNPYFL